MRSLYLLLQLWDSFHDEIKRSQASDILALSSMHISFNSARFFGLLYRILFFSAPQTFSVGWRGHWKTLIYLLLKQSCVKYAVGLGSLFCWNFHLHLLNKRFALGMSLFSNIWRYMTQSIFPSMMCSEPVPCEVKRAQTIILPPPCFTVGMVFLRSCVLIRPPNMTSGIATKKFNIVS